MTGFRLVLWWTIVLVAGGAAGPATPHTARQVEQLGWLAGCWARISPASSYEEQWMHPRGGMMMGMARLVREGTVVEYEALRMEERGNRVLYVAHPSGQESAEFTSLELSDSTAVFENADHDFPQRILYRRGGADSLFVRIEGQQGGMLRGIDFRLGRADCPGSHIQNRAGAHGRQRTAGAHALHLDRRDSRR
jgi:hypothetical protein